MAAKKAEIKINVNKSRNPALRDDCLEPSAARNVMHMGRMLMQLPDVDINDVEAVKRNVDRYYSIVEEHSLKPTVIGLAMSVGLDRRTLWAIVHDQPVNGQGFPANVCRATSDFLKKAYKYQEEIVENALLNGGTNPVGAIFLAKNHFGYQDKTEYVLTPNTASDFSPEDIKGRYLSDSDSGSDS